MIETTADFLYVANARTGIRYDQTILPAVEAAGKVPCVDAYADLPYLVEMARERAFWVNNGGDAGIAPLFDASHIVDERYPLGEVCRAIHGSMPDLTEDSVGKINLVAADWPGPEHFPQTMATVEDAQAFMRIGAGIQRYAPSRRNVPRPTENDTLRRAYYDMMRMKRYLLWGMPWGTLQCAVNNFPQYVPSSDEDPLLSVVRYWTRHDSIDGDTTDQSGNTTFTWHLGKQWQTRSGTYGVREYGEYSYGGVDVYVRKPFLLVPGYDPLDLQSARLYWTSAAAYEVYHCQVEWTTTASGHTGGDFYMIVFGDGASTTFAPTPAIVNQYYDGYVGTYPGCSLASLQSKLAFAEDSIPAYFPQYATDKADEKPVSVRIDLVDLIFDVEVTHNADLPSTWTWTPPAST